jgi:hypothetical protein
LGGIPKEEKILRSLLPYDGKWLTLNEIYSILIGNWRSGFGVGSIRSLALYLKRYRFERDGDKFLIEKRKLIIGTKKIKEWREYFESKRKVRKVDRKRQGSNSD